MGKCNISKSEALNMAKPVLFKELEEDNCKQNEPRHVISNNVAF